MNERKKEKEKTSVENKRAACNFKESRVSPNSSIKCSTCYMSWHLVCLFYSFVSLFHLKLATHKGVFLIYDVLRCSAGGLAAQLRLLKNSCCLTFRVVLLFVLSYFPCCLTFRVVLLSVLSYFPCCLTFRVVSLSVLSYFPCCLTVKSPPIPN